MAEELSWFWKYVQTPGCWQRGVWQWLAACSSPIGNGRRAGITVGVRATHRGYQGCAGGHSHRSWLVGGFPPPTSRWLCLQLWPRPFLVSLRIYRVKKHRFVQHRPGAGKAFRTRHCHLWLLSSAESCAQAGQFWQSKAANPREQSQARGGLDDASLPPCPRSGSRLNSHSRLQSLCATKKREGHILPAASNAQNSLKKFG